MLVGIFLFFLGESGLKELVGVEKVNVILFSFYILKLNMDLIDFKVL